MRVSVRPSINLLTLSYAWNKTTALDSYKKKGHFSLFLLEAMSRGDLPAFTYGGRKHPLQKSRKWYGAFEKDLRVFYARHRSDILKGVRAERYRESTIFPNQLKKLVQTFGKFSLPCTKVILCPNPFGAPGEGYGPLIGKTAYAVFTPDAKKNQTWLMVHEVCHSLLLRVFQSKNIKKLIRQTEPLMTRWSTAKFRKNYPKWEWMFEEYCIHAIEQYVTKSSVKKKLGWGMNRLTWFMASWSAFQDKRKSQPELSVAVWVEETLQTMYEIIIKK